MIIMPKETRIKTKEERIRGEKGRLNRLYRNLPEKRKKLAMPLIERAAFMRIELEDLETDLRENGWTEEFRQSEKVEPYERARPQGQTYTTLNTSYHKLIKQLSDMLPNNDQKEQSDPFDDFLAERDSM